MTCFEACFCCQIFSKVKLSLLSRPFDIQATQNLIALHFTCVCVVCRLFVCRLYAHHAGTITKDICQFTCSSAFACYLKITLERTFQTECNKMEVNHQTVIQISLPSFETSDFRSLSVTPLAGVGAGLRWKMLVTGKWASVKSADWNVTLQFWKRDTHFCSLIACSR